MKNLDEAIFLGYRNLHMSAKYLKQIVGFAVISDLILMDQLSKWAVMELVLRPSVSENYASSLGFFEWIVNAPERLETGLKVTLLPFFNLVMVWNQGVSFGLFQSGNPWPLIILACGISLFFGHWLLKSQSWVQAMSLSMIIGGALGNVIDRIRFGAVADFFDFHAFGWHYPAFNIADCGITLGIAILVFDSVVLEPKRRQGSIPA